MKRREFKPLPAYLLVRPKKQTTLDSYKTIDDELLPKKKSIMKRLREAQRETIKEARARALGGNLACDKCNAKFDNSKEESFYSYTAADSVGERCSVWCIKCFAHFEEQRTLLEKITPQKEP